MQKKEVLEIRHLLSIPRTFSSPALFLDRDGVVIEDCHHLSDPDKVQLCLGARGLIKHACRQGIPVVLITNQSGISRGLFQWRHFEMVNARMQNLLGADAPLAAIYANGHGPDAPSNSWRKPSPQMLFEAAKELNLDLSRSIMVGDRLSDLQAANSAGLAMIFHVLSGHGFNARPNVVEWYRQRADISMSGSRPPSNLAKLSLLDSLLDFPYPLLGKGELAC